MSPSWTIPECFRRSCWTEKSASTGRVEGTPFLASFRLSILSFPWRRIKTPSDSPLPSKDARPETSGDTSFIPERARSSCVTLRLTWTGVLAESAGSIGPAFPSSLMSPPPDTLAESEKGNAEVLEKSRTSMFTCSIVRGFQWAIVLLKERRQLVILTIFTERSKGMRVEEGDPAPAVLDLPSPEKFQSPEPDCNSAISG